MLYGNGNWTSCNVGDFYTEPFELYLKARNNHSNSTHPRDSSDWIIIPVRTHFSMSPVEHQIRDLEDRIRVLEAERDTSRMHMNYMLTEMAVMKEQIKHAVICSEPELTSGTRNIEL